MGFDDIDDQTEGSNNEVRYNQVINLSKHKESVRSSQDDQQEQLPDLVYNSKSDHALMTSNERKNSDTAHFGENSL